MSCCPETNLYIVMPNITSLSWESWKNQTEYTQVEKKSRKVHFSKVCLGS